MKKQLMDILSEVKFAQDNYEKDIIAGNERAVDGWWRWAKMLNDRGITTEAYLVVLRHEYMATSLGTSRAYLSAFRRAVRKYGTLDKFRASYDREYMTPSQVKVFMTATSKQKRGKRKTSGSVKREVAALVKKYGKAAVKAAINAA